MSIPRHEYPRPQFQRKDWVCLNGTWQFERDEGDTGIERNILSRELKERITVPFCPESALSGIGHVDFMNAVWYRRDVKIPDAWAGKRALLHFQACDYDTTVWVSGKEAYRHRGGHTPFTVDLSPFAKAGESVTLVVRARDDSRNQQPCGKQSMRYGNFGCHYTRTTGIWQTVWMEPVGVTAFKRPRITPDVANNRFRIETPLDGLTAKGLTVSATLSANGKQLAEAKVNAGLDLAAQFELNVPADQRKLWSPESPFLYDLAFELRDAKGTVLDRIESYAGLRSVTLDGKKVLINGKSVFQRLVLDQGYYPNGILTAPDDEALKKDIELSMQAGFNGARLHQKVFEERFLYHADKLGYLVWGEFPDWGSNVNGPAGDNQKHTIGYVTEWLEAIERDYSHPSIIGWCPLNETWQEISDKLTNLDAVTRAMFLATKALDTSRPVLDASGYSHRVYETDIYDCHDYEQNPEKFKANQCAPLAEGKPFQNGGGKWNVPYRGQPFFVSEFGGIWWNPNAKAGEDSWGYGDRVKNIEEFYARFDGLCAVLLDDPNMFGYCYTQLTDVYQEQNGIFAFDRGGKFDMARIAAAQKRPAAIEREG